MQHARRAPPASPTPPGTAQHAAGDPSMRPACALREASSFSATSRAPRASERARARWQRRRPNATLFHALKSRATVLIPSFSRIARLKRTRAKNAACRRVVFWFLFFGGGRHVYGSAVEDERKPFRLLTCRAARAAQANRAAHRSTGSGRGRRACCVRAPGAREPRSRGRARVGEQPRGGRQGRRFRSRSCPAAVARFVTVVPR